MTLVPEPAAVNVEQLSAAPDGGKSIVTRPFMCCIMFTIVSAAVSYTHLRAHETVLDHVCSLLLEKKTTNKQKKTKQKTKKNKKKKKLRLIVSTVLVNGQYRLQ